MHQTFLTDVSKSKCSWLFFKMLFCNIDQKHAPTPLLAVTSLVFMFSYDVWKCITPIHPGSRNTLRATLLTPLLSDLQPIGRAFALVQPASDRTALTPEPVKSTEEQVEVIKVGVARRLWLFCFVLRNNWCVCFVVTSVLNIRVSPCLSQVYLEARKQEQQKHQQSLKMLSDEVSQIQEVSVWTASAEALIVSLMHKHTPTNATSSQLCLLDYVTICIM